MKLHSSARQKALRRRPACPVCETASRTPLFEVSPDVFCETNDTIDREALESSGLLELPPIGLVRCRKCALVYTESLLAEDWSQTFWEKVYISSKSKDKIFRKEKRLKNLRCWERMYTFLLSHCLDDGEILNVLDFGCGWADFLMAANSPGVRAIGVEINDEKAAFVRSQGVEVYASIHEIPANIQFKAFRCDQVIEHLAQPMEFMSQIVPRLHPEFLGFVGVPDYSRARMEEIRARLTRHEKVIDKDLIPWDHVNYFSPSSLSFFINHLALAPVALPDGGAREPLRGTNSFVRFADRVSTTSLFSAARSVKTIPKIAWAMAWSLMGRG